MGWGSLLGVDSIRHTFRWAMDRSTTKLIQAFEITTLPPGKRSPPKEQENKAGSVLVEV